MRTFIIVILSAAVFGMIGYIAGGYFTAKRLARDTNYNQLMWLTAIDVYLDKGQIDHAKEIAKTSADGTMMLLADIDRTHLPILALVAGGFTCDKTVVNRQIATRAKQHFLPISTTMSQESRNFLKGIVEVDLPRATSPVKKKNGS